MQQLGPPTVNASEFIETETEDILCIGTYYLLLNWQPLSSSSSKIIAKKGNNISYSVLLPIITISTALTPTAGLVIALRFSCPISNIIKSKAIQLV